MNQQLKDLIDFIDALPYALLLTDKQHTIRLVNKQAEQLFAYTKNELMGQDKNILAQAMPRELEKAHYELKGIKKDKRTFSVQMHVGQWTNKDKETLSLLSFCPLASKASFDAEPINAVQEQFLATMNHQLRTPLNAILGFSEILLLKLAGELSFEQEKQLNIIHKSGKHLLPLVNDLSELTKIDAGDIFLTSEAVNLNELIQNIISSHQAQAEEKQLNLKKQLPNKVITIQTNKSSLRKIITNIVNNAIKFSEKGSVNIKVKDEKDKIMVQVSDSGVGIKKEKLERIFLAFQQLYIAEKKNEGSGLGLHICKKLADLIDVDIVISSEYGKGTQCSIIIPKS